MHEPRPKVGLLALLSLVVLLALVACGGEQAAEQPATEPGDEAAAPAAPLKIGAAFPLTGDFAAYGETWRNGTQMAVDEINEAGGVNGSPIQLAMEDWATDDARAVTVFTKLANVDRVPVILTGGSGAVLAQAPVANRTQTVLLNGAAQTPALAEAGEYAFSNINTADAEAADLVRFMKEELGISEAVIYYVDNPTGEGGRAGLEAAAEQFDVRIIDSVAHSFQDTNYRTVLSRIRGMNPPAVIVASHWENTGISLRQAREIGLETTWLGLSPTVSDVTIEASGVEAIEDFYTIRSEYDIEKEEEGPTKEFVDKYVERFGAEPDIYAAHFYDAVYMLRDLAENGATDGASFAEALSALGESNPWTGGVTGEVAFDENGMVRKGNYILVVKSGQLGLVD